MKSSTSSAVPGCIVWIIMVSILTTCFMPLAFIMGGLTSSSSLAIQTTGKFLCPQDTNPQSYSYDTTRTDENGNTQPATAYELHCVDANGQIVKKDSVIYSFLWIGAFAMAGSILAVAISLPVAAPAGVLISRLLNRARFSGPPAAIRRADSQ
jgi:hypothetical protein